MYSETAKPTDRVSADVQIDPAFRTRVGAGGVFCFKCYDKDGNLKWGEETHNLVVNQGLKDMNDKYFSGVAYTSTWFLGLINNTPTPFFSANDTAASHAGWVEFTAYFQTTRPVAIFGSATTADPSVISNSISPATFNISNDAIIAGAFLISNNTKAGTTGVLFSEANFQAPNTRAVVNGDILIVTYQFNLDAV